MRAEKDKLKAEKIKCEKELARKKEKVAKKETIVHDINVSQENTIAVTKNENDKRKIPMH